MLRRVFESLCALILAPLVSVARAEAAKQSADAVSDLLKRAQQAEDDGQPELARKLREFAGTLPVEGKHEEQPALPAPSTNGAQLPAPKKLGRPRREVPHGQES